ncbi:MAG: SRPBCC family protein [Solirubrobacterales bacterium]|nr:SRPBCC family protein [Solirubrobacterales bacterium]MBV9715860.1 SRPBCC family protein [Solirubrobacterales bacterium]
MSQRDERLDARGLGVEVVLRPTGQHGGDEDGAQLTFDVIGEAKGFITLPHVHTSQAERYEVIAGQMRLRLAGRTYLLRAGDCMETPAGTAHTQLPAGSEPAHIRVTVRPAGSTEAFLRRLAEMSAAGQFTRGGMPRPVAAARLIRDFADAGHGTIPPMSLQHVLSRVILWVAECEQPLTWGARRLGREYVFVDEWEVAAAPRAVYDVLAEERTYPHWWRPVYIDVVTDGPPAVGRIAHQHFKGRLPYHLRTLSRIVRLDPGEVIEADVEGDLHGHGTWTLTPSAGGTHVRFDWNVHADRLLLRILTPLLRPALRANHNWAIARAIEGLEPYVLATTGATTLNGDTRQAERHPAHAN